MICSPSKNSRATSTPSSTRPPRLFRRSKMYSSAPLAAKNCTADATSCCVRATNLSRRICPTCGAMHHSFWHMRAAQGGLLSAAVVPGTARADPARHSRSSNLCSREDYLPASVLDEAGVNGRWVLGRPLKLHLFQKTAIGLLHLSSRCQR